MNGYKNILHALMKNPKRGEQKGRISSRITLFLTAELAVVGAMMPFDVAVETEDSKWCESRHERGERCVRFCEPIKLIFYTLNNLVYTLYCIT